jgi:hypothetical protein
MSDAKNDAMSSKQSGFRAVPAKLRAAAHGRGRTVGLAVIAVLFVGLLAAAAVTLSRRPFAKNLGEATQTAVKESEEKVKDTVENAKESLAQAVGHKPTLAELTARVKADPKDAMARRQLGDAMFDSLRLGPALHQYHEALKLNPKVADSEMVSHLVSCFGSGHQKAAARLITDYKLTSAAPALAPLTRNTKYDVRWGAVKTLNNLGMANRTVYIHAYVADLDSSECALKRRAVEQLGSIGDKHALSAIEVAAKKDKAEKHWYWFSCLGDRTQQAAKEIRERTRLSMGS